MQFASATVRLGGSLLNTVFRDTVTPPEVLVLERIHGEGSVVDVVRKFAPDRDISAKAEKARLLDRFPSHYAKLIDEMFPGVDPRMPMTFEDAGITLAGDNSASARKKSAATRKESVEDPLKE